MKNKEVVVADSGPLIGLAKIGRFALLKTLFRSISIPETVYHEVVQEGAGKPGAVEVARAVEEGWIVKHKLQSSRLLVLLKVELDEGEAEAVMLANELKARLLLIDERKGRVRAERMQLKIMGTVGILLLAKAKGVDIDLREALDRLRNEGFRLSDRLYERVLANQ